MKETLVNKKSLESVDRALSKTDHYLERSPSKDFADALKSTRSELQKTRQRVLEGEL